jgi:hypothetical protein
MSWTLEMDSEKRCYQPPEGFSEWASENVMELCKWTLKRATMNEASENVGELWKWTLKTAVVAS